MRRRRPRRHVPDEWSCRSDAPRAACAGTGRRRHRRLPASSVAPSTAEWSYSVNPIANAVMVVTVPDTPMMVRVLPAGTVLNASSICSSMSAIASCDLSLGRRIVLQMTLRHTHRPDVHGERGLHLRARMALTPSPPSTSSVEPPPRSTTRYGASTVATDDAGGTKEA